MRGHTRVVGGVDVGGGYWWGHRVPLALIVRRGKRSVVMMTLRFGRPELKRLWGHFSGLCEHVLMHVPLWGQ